MAIYHSDYVTGVRRLATPDKAGEVVAHRYTFPYVGGNHSDGDIVELGILPAGCTVLDMTVIVDDVDSGTDFEWDLGLMNGKVGDDVGPDGVTARTCGAEFFANATSGQSAAVARMSKADGFRIEPVDYDRSIGLKLIDQGASSGNFTLIALIAAV